MKKINFSLENSPQIPSKSKENVQEILDRGNLFRYGEQDSSVNHVSLLEKEFSEYLGTKYCVGVNSCGSAMFISLKALNVQAGDKVLFNAFTLAPVPGAIEHAGAIPVPVDITNNYRIDFSDLKDKAKKNNAKVLLVSHMRGHIANMEKLISLCNELNITVIEDCAHTMGAKWSEKFTGTFGVIGCFSTQSFKHINSGEGGLLVTNDKHIMAKSILYSGSYALYEQHIARPEKEVFEQYYGHIPNFSLRMSNLAAAILRPQLNSLIENKIKWNSLYELLFSELNRIKGVEVLSRDSREEFIGSSIQFNISGLSYEKKNILVDVLEKYGVFLKWFGNENPKGFTEKYSQWKYINATEIKNIDFILNDLFDMRVPVSLSESECKLIANIIEEQIKILL